MRSAAEKLRRKCRHSEGSFNYQPQPTHSLHARKRLKLTSDFLKVKVKERSVPVDRNAMCIVLEL